MSANAQYVIDALNHSFIQDHPASAFQAINQLSEADLIDMISRQPMQDQIRIWNDLDVDLAASLTTKLTDQVLHIVINEGDPVHTSRVLVRLSQSQRDQVLGLVDVARQRELIELSVYPDDSAGALMDPRFVLLNDDLTVRQALHRIRRSQQAYTRQLYIINHSGHLSRMVEMHKLAFAQPGDMLQTLSQPVPAVVTATAPREEVVEQLDKHRITDLPVVDVNGQLIGIIRYDVLMDTMREDSSADLLTMVGASRDERALSKVNFVVKKRLPWLSINLLTAFLAASVVGLFENIIAQFTALAVLLPVVAGQSGNTGAQALAVTMRALALREIGTSHWVLVARKEVAAGFINGVGIALLTSAGVFAWSQSTGLALVIGVSMVIAMVAAGFSGVIIPIMLAKLGQDPAQSSSIILTTVTDVVGFFAFLGIATMLSGML
jgi:magnesium transporter